MYTATFNDPWAGPVEVRMVPMRSDKTRFWWKRENGQIVGAQARAMTAARCVQFAKAHRSFSNVQAAS